MAIRIEARSGNIAYIRILIERLRVERIRIRYRNRNRTPIRSDKPPQPIRVIPCPKIIKPGFAIPFLTREFVMIGIVIDELEFAAPRIEVRFGLDDARYYKSVMIDAVFR